MLFARMRFILLAGLLFTAPLAVAVGATPTDQLVKQGEYVYRAAGCYGCHTDEKHAGKPLAGGHALATPFGTFYTPNIARPRNRHRTLE
jgi:mono/diheme cytochrome c family protein